MREILVPFLIRMEIEYSSYMCNSASMRDKGIGKQDTTWHTLKLFWVVLVLVGVDSRRF